MAGIGKTCLAIRAILAPAARGGGPYCKGDFMTYDDRPRPEESRLRGDDSALLLEDSIAGLLARTVAARPDAEALVFREHGLRLSWREFAQAVDRLATGLLGLGVGRGLIDVG